MDVYIEMPLLWCEKRAKVKTREEVCMEIALFERVSMRCGKSEETVCKKRKKMGM